MNQVLSQSEVDALLAAVSEGEIETSEGSGTGSNDDRVVVVYDLTSQDRIIRGRLPQLDVIYEKFMRAFRVSLSSSLRKIASLNHASTDFLKFGEFINTLPMPTCMSVLRFSSLRGSALLVIESKLAYALVDSFFGGDDRPYSKVEGKDFTPIEISIIRKVVDLAIQDLEGAWESVHKIDCSFVRTEVNPQFVGIVPPTDVVIASAFDVELENANGTITLVIPYSTIEPIKQKLSSGFQVESDQTDKKLWTSIIREQLLETDVDINVHLGQTEIKMEDLMHMKEGDVIPLDQDATGEFEVLVENVKKFKGLYGIYHGSVAMQITNQLLRRDAMSDAAENIDDIIGDELIDESGPELVADGSPQNIDLILDIPLRVTVELGRTKMIVSELLNLGQGSVIELNKLAGEPMEILVNDKLVARGEAVVVNEKFGVRLTDIISPKERVEQLK